MRIVLGGTSGVGFEIAQNYRQRGERVLVIGREHTLEQYGEGFAMDLSNRDSIVWALKELAGRVGQDKIDQFVWSAGYGWRGNFEDQPFVQIMGEVNFAGALPLLQWAWQKMIAQTETSCLTVIGSTSSVKPRPDEAVYVATKHAQAGLARSLGMAAESQSLPVKVALFLPGGMKTAFWDGRDKPASYDTFNDPAKVAAEIIRLSDEQTAPYLEKAFPKNSLV